MIVSKMPRATKITPKKTERKVQFASTKPESSDDSDDDVEGMDEESSANESANEDAVSNIDEDEGGSTDDADDESDDSKANAGWADAMQRILNTKKPKRKKTIVLSKAKRLCDVKAKPTGPGFEIDGEDKSVEPVTPEVKQEKEADHSRRKRREVDLGIRVKPSILDRERERTIQKIATKGVVQLFNVVRQQQKDIKKQLEEAGPLERKREAVMKNIDKRAFLDVLMGGSKSVPVDGPVKNEKKEKEKKDEIDENEKTWDVLRDDFMMGAKLKDWDKEADDDEVDSSAPEDMDSDD